MEENMLLPINLDYLKQLSSGNTDFEREMLTLYLEEVGKDAIEMNVAFDNSDFKTVAYIGHKLKSSIQLIGYESLVDTLSVIESFAKKTTLTADEQAFFKQLTVQLNQSFIDIQELLAERS